MKKREEQWEMKVNRETKKRENVRDRGKKQDGRKGNERMGR